MIYLFAFRFQNLCDMCRGNEKKITKVLKTQAQLFKGR